MRRRLLESNDFIYDPQVMELSETSPVHSTVAEPGDVLLLYNNSELIIVKKANYNTDTYPEDHYIYLGNVVTPGKDNCYEDDSVGVCATSHISKGHLNQEMSGYVDYNYETKIDKFYEEYFEICGKFLAERTSTGKLKYTVSSTNSEVINDVGNCLLPVIPSLVDTLYENYYQYNSFLYCIPPMINTSINYDMVIDLYSISTGPLLDVDGLNNTKNLKGDFIYNILAFFNDTNITGGNWYIPSIRELFYKNYYNIDPFNSSTSQSHGTYSSTFKDKSEAYCLGLFSGICTKVINSPQGTVNPYIRVKSNKPLGNLPGQTEIGFHGFDSDSISALGESTIEVTLTQSEGDLVQKVGSYITTNGCKGMVDGNIQTLSPNASTLVWEMHLKPNTSYTLNSSWNLNNSGSTSDYDYSATHYIQVAKNRTSIFKKFLEGTSNYTNTFTTDTSSDYDLIIDSVCSKSEIIKTYSVRIEFILNSGIPRLVYPISVHATVQMQHVTTGEWLTINYTLPDVKINSSTELPKLVLSTYRTYTQSLVDSGAMFQDYHANGIPFKLQYTITNADGTTFPVTRTFVLTREQIRNNSKIEIS